MANKNRQSGYDRLSAPCAIAGMRFLISTLTSAAGGVVADLPRIRTLIA